MLLPLIVNEPLLSEPVVLLFGMVTEVPTGRVTVWAGRRRGQDELCHRHPEGRRRPAVHEAANAAAEINPDPLPPKLSRTRADVFEQTWIATAMSI